MYENHDNFATLPSYGVVPPFSCQVSIPFGEFLPKFDFVRRRARALWVGVACVLTRRPSSDSRGARPFLQSRLLHGEQYLEIHQAIPTSGSLFSTPRLIDALDKGKVGTDRRLPHARAGRTAALMFGGRPARATPISLGTGRTRSS